MLEEALAEEARLDGALLGQVWCWERTSMAWVLFDYGNVICRPQPEHAVADLARAAGSAAGEFGDAYWAHRLPYDRGDLDGTTYWQKVAASLGRSFSSSEIVALTCLDIASWLHLDAETVALVEDVAAAGYRLALLSNAPAEVAEVVTVLPFARYFERCEFSCFLRLAKPDPACYRAVLERLGASPGEVVFLDDRKENVAGAAALGMKTVHFTGPGQARAGLASHGVVAGCPAPGPASHLAAGMATGRPPLAGARLSSGGYAELWES